MPKNRLKLRGIILIVTAWVIGITGFSLKEAGAAPILFWIGFAGYAMLLWFGLAAIMKAHNEKQEKEYELRKERWKNL